MAILAYQDSDAKIMIHHFSIKKSSSSREVLVDPLIEKFTPVVEAKDEFENLDVIIDTIFGISGRSRIESKEKTYALRAKC